MLEKALEVICIRCPKGCRIKIEKKGENIKIEGYECPLGKTYAEEEITNPKRVVTSTVRILGAIHPRLPVRTLYPIPKYKIKDVINALRGIVIEAPVRKGQIIIDNVCGTGVPIIAERDMERVKE
ncbi:MAG: molybdopterin oxidoreductase [Candidatus Latescibacterota bacterium]|nr:MAG: molybdopterin oxidoreductase [Candidatus Latescibacterota bacterium]